MKCYVCGEESIGQCKRCGKYYCQQHGDQLCTACFKARRDIGCATIVGGIGGIFLGGYIGALASSFSSFSLLTAMGALVALVGIVLGSLVVLAIFIWLWERLLQKYAPQQVTHWRPVVVTAIGDTMHGGGPTRTLNKIYGCLGTVIFLIAFLAFAYATTLIPAWQGIFSRSITGDMALDGAIAGSIVGAIVGYLAVGHVAYLWPTVEEKVDDVT